MCITAPLGNGTLERDAAIRLPKLADICTYSPATTDANAASYLGRRLSNTVPRLPEHDVMWMSHATDVVELQHNAHPAPLLAVCAREQARLCALTDTATSSPKRVRGAL